MEHKGESSDSLLKKSAAEKIIAALLLNNNKRSSDHRPHVDFNEASSKPIPPFLGRGANLIQFDGYKYKSRLYVGNKVSAAKERESELLKLRIGGVVNCALAVPNFHETTTNIGYHKVRIGDNEKNNILPFLLDATSFIHEKLCNGESVLIHCEMGISRSCTVAIAYLMRYYQLSRDEAYIIIKQSRILCHPNYGFWCQLKDFEKVCKDELDGCK